MPTRTELKTVSYRSYSASNEQVPSLILQGLYLKGCGFGVGARFRTHLDWGKIVIELMDESKMNEYQLQNIHRKEATRPDLFGYSYSRCLRYRCVECGREVSPGAVFLYRYDVLVLKCLACRKHKNLNQLAYEPLSPQ